MIKIGKINQLTVLALELSSYVLEEPTTHETVKMPFNLTVERPEIGSQIDVFVYMDTNNNKVATSALPIAQVGEYALMRVKKVEEFGSFMSWGIQKDLLVPGNEQKIDMQHGEEYLVRVCLEEGTDRVFGSTKLGKFIEDTEFDIHEGDKVKLVPVHKTDLGYKVVVNKKYIGQIYQNEIFQPIRIEEEYFGIVKKIRIDGLIDAALQVQGIKNLDQSQKKILNFLKENDGEFSLHDKSTPEEIKYHLAMSKKTFKNAIGMLYKQKKIIISDTGIKLVGA